MDTTEVILDALTTAAELLTVLLVYHAFRLLTRRLERSLMSQAKAKIQHDKTSVFLVIEDEDGKKEFKMDAALARDLGEALFKTGCTVGELVKNQ